MFITLAFFLDYPVSLWNLGVMLRCTFGGPRMASHRRIRCVVTKYPPCGSYAGNSRIPSLYHAAALAMVATRLGKYPSGSLWRPQRWQISMLVAEHGRSRRPLLLDLMDALDLSARRSQYRIKGFGTRKNST
jgi:hypothetical protein